MFVVDDLRKLKQDVEQRYRDHVAQDRLHTIERTFVVSELVLHCSFHLLAVAVPFKDLLRHLDRRLR